MPVLQQQQYPVSPTVPYTLSGFTGSSDTLNEMVRVAQGPRGEKSMMVRSLVEEAIGKIWPKDYAGEILACNYWAMQNVIYVNDPLHVELIKDPQRIVEEYRAKGWARGDCDDIATMIGTMCTLLGRESQFVVVGFRERGNFSHVFCRVREPKTRKWIVCDPVAGTNVRQMLGRVTTYQVWSLDEPPGTGPLKEI
jgi:hypothetical protein